MKVTVNFDNVRVIVPCGAGELLVRDLMQLAITRYKKATSKTPNTWVVIHNLKLSSDGGILDPDDRLNDVADDREQIIAIYEEQNSPYQHHHNGGDGTSASSVGTESPDIFQIEVNHNTLPNNNGGIKVADYGDVEITGSHTPSGITPLQVRRGSEPALNRLSPVSSDPDPTKRWSAAVMVGDSDIKPQIRRANSVGHSEDEDDEEEEEEEEEDDDSRGEGSGEEKSTSSRLSRGSGRLSILGNGTDMCRWAEAADRQLYKSFYPEDSRREPLGSSGTSPDHSRDVESETSSLGDDRELMIVLKNETGPLGIHVVPEYDSSGRDMGLVIQSIEPGGRTDRDGRLSVGDRIVDISGRSLVHVSFPKAQEIFKDALKKADIKLRLIKSVGGGGAAGSENLSQTTSNRNIVNEISPGSSNGPPPIKKPPPPVYPKPFVNKSATVPSPLKKEGELEIPALVEGEERGGLVTKVATVTPTKKVPSNGSRPVSQNAPLASNTRKIGRKIPIQLTKGAEGLGFSITTRDNPAGGNCPIYIKNILPKGAAIQDGRLKPGDRLLEVNGLEMTGKTQTEAVALLRNTPPGGMVDLVVSRQESESIQLLPRELPSEQSEVGDSIIPWKHREVLTFDIPLNDTGSAGLGVSVKGKSTTGPNGPVDLGIFVKSVIHGGAASKDGRLCTNDQLVNINGISLLSMTNTQAMETLRRAMTQGEGPNALPNAITLTVARRIASSNENQNGVQNGSGDDGSSISFGSHDRSDSVLSSGSSIDNLLCIGIGMSPIKGGHNGTICTPDNSTSEASETTVIFKPRSSSTDSLDHSGARNPFQNNSNHHPVEEGALKKQLSGRNPVIDRLMGQNGIRNESHLKGNHENWASLTKGKEGTTTAGYNTSSGGANDPRLRITNPQFRTSEKVVIEDEYNSISKCKTRSRTPDNILTLINSPPPPPPSSSKLKSSEIDTIGKENIEEPTTPNEQIRLCTGDQEKDANFYRDGFGRQSISEKRHAQLDARNTDTYQRNKKLREEKEKRGESLSDEEELEQDHHHHRRQEDQQHSQIHPGKAEEKENPPPPPPSGRQKMDQMNRTRSQVVNGGNPSGVNLIRSSSAESLLRPSKVHPPGSCQSPGCPYHAVTTGGGDSVSSQGTTIGGAQTSKSSSSGGGGGPLGPSLGMRKSSSLESLQTMVQELQREEVGRRNGTRNRAGNGGVGGPSRGRGCNESFRAAVDRSYEGPAGTTTAIGGAGGITLTNADAINSAETLMEILEEESESGGSSQGGPIQRGKPLAMSSRQPSLSHDQRAQRHLLHQPANDDMLHAYNNKEMESKAGKKKGGLLKGLGSVFKFGKHRKISQETIQKLTREQLEQEAERLKARRAAQEEQERIQEQYRKLVEQQKHQQLAPPPPKESLQSSHNPSTLSSGMGGPPPPPIPSHHSSSSLQHQHHHQQQQQQQQHHQHHPGGGTALANSISAKDLLLGTFNANENSLLLSSPSRQERMQLLRAQHQRKHQERQGHYPKDEQEEWYEKDLKHRIDRAQQGRRRPLPSLPIVPFPPKSQLPPSYCQLNDNYIYQQFHQLPPQPPKPSSGGGGGGVSKIFTAHSVLRRTFSLYSRQRPSDPEVSNHARSTSFDIYKEIESQSSSFGRPGSRRGIADPSKFSHYMNYKEIQQHLRQYQHQEQQQQQQQQLQQQHSLFPAQTRYPPSTAAAASVQNSPQKHNSNTAGVTSSTMSNQNSHFHQINKTVGLSSDSIQTSKPPQQQQQREKRPISNYFEYESVQATYHAASQQQSAEINAASLPRKTTTQQISSIQVGNNSSNKQTGPLVILTHSSQHHQQQQQQQQQQHGARVKTQSTYIQHNMPNGTHELNGGAYQQQHHQHHQQHHQQQHHPRGGVPVVSPQNNNGYPNYTQIGGHRRESNIPGSKV